MTPQQVVDLARDNTNVSTRQVSDSLAMKYFNISYRRIYQKFVTKLGENYFWTTWKRDAVADQTNGEYPIPTTTSSTNAIHKITGVWVKPSADANQRYIAAREIDIKDLRSNVSNFANHGIGFGNLGGSFDWEWLLDNQSTSDPIYFVGENSVFIAPNFTTDTVGVGGSNQIKLEGIKQMKDLLISDTEADIVIAKEYHYMIAMGMEWQIMKKKGNLTESSSLKSEFFEEIDDMISLLTNRTDDTDYANSPSELELE